MEQSLVTLLVVLAIVLLSGLIAGVSTIRHHRRYDRKVRIEGKVPGPARTLGKKFRLLFVPNVRKKTDIQEIVLEQLFQALNCPFVVHVSPPPESEALEDGSFHVLLNTGANQQAERIVRPNELFAMSCTAGDPSAWQTSGTGFPIVDRSTGFVVGELFDRRLYVHVDILAGGHQPQLGLLEAVLCAARGEIDVSRSVKPSLTVTESAHPVTAEGWGNRERDLIAALARSTLSPAVGKAIVVKNAKGNTVFPVRNDCFNVFVHSAPVGELSVRPVDQYHFFELVPPTYRLMFRASEYGRLVTDSYGSPVAELVENNLYIHLQAVEMGTYTELAILKQIFARAVRELEVIAKRRVELIDQAREALPHFADKIDVHIDSPFVKPANADRLDIYPRRLPNFPSPIANHWLELNEENRLPVPFSPGETQALWYLDLPVLEVVGGNRIFMNADVWPTDEISQKDFSATLNVLVSELKAKEYIDELLGSPVTLPEGQSFTFIDNGLSGISRQLIEGVARRIVPARVDGKSVRVIFCKGQEYNPAYDGEFSIFLASKPRPRHSSNHWGFYNSTLGAPVAAGKRDPVGPVGELFHDNFFLYKGPLSRGSYTEAASFAETLGRALQVREQVESDRMQIEALTKEIIGDRIQDPIVVYTGSRVIAQRAPGAFNIYFGESSREQPDWHWWVAGPEGLTSLAWLGMPTVATPIFNDNGQVIGKFADSDVFLNVRVEPGEFGAKRRALSEALKQLKIDLGYRAYIKNVIELARQEDAGLQVPLQMVRSYRYPNARSEALITGLCKDLLLARVGTDIEVMHGGKGQVEPKDDSMFHVIVAGAPEKERMQTVPESIFGHAFAGSGDTFIPSPSGQPIVDEETGFVVGELQARNLYIFEDLSRRNTFADAALVARFLLEARKLLIAGAVPQTASRHFARDCADSFEQARAITADPAALSEARRELRKILIQAAKDEAIYYQTDLGSELGEEFDQLVKIPKVTDIEVTSDALTVYTTRLYCTNPDTGFTHEIGTFKIKISLRDGNVNWKNLTRTVIGGSGYMQAPHVGPEGHACLGNTLGVFPDLIAKRDLLSAVLLAIAFVESVNVDDYWGKFIVNWPRV